MTVRKKADVLKGISREVRSNGGKPYVTYAIYFGTDELGKQIRTTRPSLAQARLCVDEYFRALAERRGVAVSLKPRQSCASFERLGLPVRAFVLAIRPVLSFQLPYTSEWCKINLIWFENGTIISL